MHLCFLYQLIFRNGHGLIESLHFEIDKFRAIAHLLADGKVERLDRAVGRRADRVFHFHGFKDQERRALVAHGQARNPNSLQLPRHVA